MRGLGSSGLPYVVSSPGSFSPGTRHHPLSLSSFSSSASKCRPLFPRFLLFAFQRPSRRSPSSASPGGCVAMRRRYCGCLHSLQANCPHSGLQARNGNCLLSGQHPSRGKPLHYNRNPSRGQCPDCGLHPPQECCLLSGSHSSEVYCIILTRRFTGAVPALSAELSKAHLPCKDWRPSQTQCVRSGRNPSLR